MILQLPKTFPKSCFDLPRMQRANDKKIKSLELSHKTQIDIYKESHKDELEQFCKENVVLQESKDSKMKLTAKGYIKKINSQNVDHETETNALKSSHKEELEHHALETLHLQTSKENIIQIAREDFDKEILNSLNLTIKIQINKLRSYHAKEVDRLEKRKLELQKLKGNEIKSLTNGLVKEINSLNTNHESETNEL